MRFDIYGQFDVEVVREYGQWAVYRIGKEVRMKEHDIVIPAALDADGVLAFLDDVYRDLAEPGMSINPRT